MSSSCREMTDVETMSDLSTHTVFISNDIICEILLLLPSKTLFKLILVSKRLLKLISNPQFRYTYLQKWKPSFYLVGFFVSNSLYLGRDGDRRLSTKAALPFMPTATEGNEIDSSGLLKKLGYYIDSSNGILLCGRHPKDYYLWDPSTWMHHQLPRPRVYFKEQCMSLITEDCLHTGYSYKVVRAECLGVEEQSKKVRIETYCSKTNRWSYSELTCPEPISLTPWTPGKVIEGVVFWYTRGYKVVIYDSNDEEKKIDVIALPHTYLLIGDDLGESSDGCLQYGWSRFGEMEIWKLDKVSKDLRKAQLEWNLQYTLSFEMMWSRNASLASGNVRKKRTQFFAFLNMNSESFYIRCGSDIFIYHKQTGDLEYLTSRVCCRFAWDSCKVVPYFRRFWPSPLW